MAKETAKLTFDKAYDALCKEYGKSYVPMLRFDDVMTREAIIGSKQVSAGMIEIDLPKENKK